MTRFDLPSVGPAVPVQFPEWSTVTHRSGLQVRTIPWTSVPIVGLAIVVPGGAAADPADRPGLIGFVADMLDEGAGSRDTIALADALTRIGSRIDIEVGADATIVGLTTLSRHLATGMALLADVVTRPHLDQTAFDRVQELRLSRLQQLRRTPSAVADRALLGAVFGRHPYGHGALGTTVSLSALTLDEVRDAWQRLFGIGGATLVVGGDVTPPDVEAAIAASGFHDGPDAIHDRVQVPESIPRVDLPAGRRVLLVERPGAPQSEVRVGQIGPPRRTPDYHALVTLNALLGGQFTSRLNRNLRETRGITYGARTGFDFRRIGGTFECDASVQGDATADAVREMLREMDAVRIANAIGAGELDLAKASLTRGYARGFETARQLVRAAAHLSTHGLADDTFDRFVPEVERLSAADLTTAAEWHLHPEAASIVVVGDASSRDGLAAFGDVEIVEPEF